MAGYARRVKLSPFLASLLRSQMEKAIDEAVLSHDEEIVARLILVEKQAQADVAEEVLWSRSTVSKRLPAIMKEVEKTARTLFP